MDEVEYEELRQLFLNHEYRARAGGYGCSCGWSGASVAEHLADRVCDWLES